ncbi:hypothetical protein E2C01_058816 [Portunus trituberculatus]|uniref:Uncharacterized protein n=1 Tax=Portunus trituberculatus TaxID=210409 RepID=A0A5B7H468_PORTR|nr:hypothetical protein [Portunus trituberculatus]
MVEVLSAEWCAPDQRRPSNRCELADKTGVRTEVKEASILLRCALEAEMVMAVVPCVSQSVLKNHVIYFLSQIHETLQKRSPITRKLIGCHLIGGTRSAHLLVCDDGERKMVRVMMMIVTPHDGDSEVNL